MPQQSASASAPPRGPRREPSSAAEAVEQERERLAVLADLGILDAPAEEHLHAVVRLAAALAGVPNATINLIDDDSQCQLVTVGFEGGTSEREESMCARHFLAKQTVFVPDASESPDYAANAWVDGRRAAVRLYASVPLVTTMHSDDGHALGTLCVFDTVAGSLTPEQLGRLEDLASLTVAQFERSRAAREQTALRAAADEQRALVGVTMAELEARTELTEAVLDTVDVAIVAAGPDGRLAMFNRAARLWHGLDADSAVDPNDLPTRYSLRRADGVRALSPEEAPLQRALVEGSVDGVEIVIAPEDLPARSVQVSGRRLVRRDGTPLGAVIAQTDVTPARARERALQAVNLELARSNTELERFAAVAAHDLRSPLAVVDGYLELLADVAAGDLPAQALGWIATARRAVGRMTSLTGALLGYAQAGNPECSREEVDVRDLLDQVVVDLRTQVAEARATISAEGELPSVMGDPTLLRQLLQNLVGNALGYRRADRECRVSVSAMHDDAQGAWTFAVADNGKGVPPEAREQVFTMFTTTGAIGTSNGIGLATCQRIVERHGGRIWLKETPGGGATVLFTLPDEVERGS